MAPGQGSRRQAADGQKMCRSWASKHTLHPQRLPHPEAHWQGRKTEAQSHGTIRHVERPGKALLTRGATL